jgi:hypothetical protein
MHLQVLNMWNEGKHVWLLTLPCGLTNKRLACCGGGLRWFGCGVLVLETVTASSAGSWCCPLVLNKNWMVCVHVRGHGG